MKKLLLPIAVIAASGAYVWTQQRQLEPDTVLDTTAAISMPEAGPAPAASVPAPVTPSMSASPEVAVPAATHDDGDEDEDDTPLPIRRPAPKLPVGIVEASTPAPEANAPSAVLAAAPALPAGAFADGTYDGPAANAYYGLVQVAAVIQDGQLAKVKILQYPSDRRTSRFINQQALPLLVREAIRAQSGNVDFISGATLTSNAFAKSLGAALAQARG
ncbi:MAG TPA: FMN-binding protein [Devosia sp.]|nr:FMN-binding protein [Devosia sp.]